uniref:Uncharacterized protein n=1 Tax=Bubo bubo TaxID=30461 RepID=A0A8C0EDY9_BUBBB
MLAGTLSAGPGGYQPCAGGKVTGRPELPLQLLGWGWPLAPRRDVLWPAPVESRLPSAAPCPDVIIACTVLNCSLGARGAPSSCIANHFPHHTYQRRAEVFPENGSLLLQHLRLSDSGVYSVRFRLSYQTWRVTLTVKHRGFENLTLHSVNSQFPPCVLPPLLDLCHRSRHETDHGSFVQMTLPQLCCQLCTKYMK